MFSERPPLRQRGVTMVELNLFIVIVVIAEGLLEEVELARFSYCDPADPDAGDAATVKSSADCKTAPEKWGQLSPEPTGANDGRPFDNVNDYVAGPGVPTAAFD